MTLVSRAGWTLLILLSAVNAAAVEGVDAYDWGGWFQFEAPPGCAMTSEGDAVTFSGDGIVYGVSLRATSRDPNTYGKALIDSLRLNCPGFEMSTELEGFHSLMPTISLYYDITLESQPRWSGLTLATPMSGMVLLRSVQYRVDDEGYAPAGVEEAGSAWLSHGFTYADTLLMRSWIEGPHDILARGNVDPGSHWIVLRDHHLKMKFPTGWKWQMYHPPYAYDYPQLQLVGPNNTRITVYGPDTGSLDPSGYWVIQNIRKLCEDESECPDCDFVGEYPVAHHTEFGAKRLSFTCNDGDRRVEYLVFEQRTEHLKIEYDSGSWDNTEDIEASLEFTE
jgi:hypothetical protein